MRRFLALTIVFVVVGAVFATNYVYHGPLFSAKSSAKSAVVTVHILRGSSIPPSGFNAVSFQENFPTGSYPYPVKLRLTSGVNNTIEWINDDTEGHTVTALVAPSADSRFNSGLISAGQTFIVTLTMPGVYRYTCAWHNWLAGQITVKSA